MYQNWLSFANWNLSQRFEGLSLCNLSAFAIDAQQECTSVASWTIRFRPGLQVALQILRDLSEREAVWTCGPGMRTHECIVLAHIEEQGPHAQLPTRSTCAPSCAKCWCTHSASYIKHTQIELHKAYQKPFFLLQVWANMDFLVRSFDLINSYFPQDPIHTPFPPAGPCYVIKFDWFNTKFSSLLPGIK